MSDEFFRRLEARFPAFAGKLQVHRNADPENVQPPATAEDLQKLETAIGVKLPDSYKELLQCARMFSLFGGAIQFGFQHPFLHEFQPLEKFSPAMQQSILQRGGGVWPPPSDGMLCFAEYFLEADGDQVLVDVSRGLIDGEYPIMYYAHESHPPSVRQLSGDFETFLNTFLDDEHWSHS